MTHRTTTALLLLAMAIPSLATAQDRSVADFMAAIEGAQAEAGDQGLGELTIAELMDRFNVPGISVAVIKDFEVHWEKGYGVADVETGAPVDTETLFQAASISKPVAAMGVLRAVQDGLFGLDDDINDILTSWTLDGGEFTRDRPVTPRTLTSHTSGLGDGFGFPGYDPDAELPTVVQILDGHELSNVRRVFMERAPWTGEEYSGGGTTVMQQALTDARGRPFPEFMREQVLEPAGMLTSTFQQPLPPDRDRNATRAHNGEGEAMGPKWHVYPELAAAGLWTTSGDLARFAVEVQKSAIGESNRVLNRTMVQEMLSPVGVGGFAVGFAIERMGRGWYFSHGGGNWGYRCILLAHRVKGYGLAIMTNADNGGAVMGEVSRRIQRAYEWDSLEDPLPRGYDPPVERVEIEVARDILATYVGEYEFPDLQVTITLEGAGLHIEVPGQGKFPMFAEAEDRFFLKVSPALLTFTKNDTGVVTGALFGDELVGHKVR